MNEPDMVLDVADVAGVPEMYIRSSGFSNVPSLFQSTQMPKSP